MGPTSETTARCARTCRAVLKSRASVGAWPLTRVIRGTPTEPPAKGVDLRGHDIASATVCGLSDHPITTAVQRTQQQSPQTPWLSWQRSCLPPPAMLAVAPILTATRLQRRSTYRLPRCANACVKAALCGRRGPRVRHVHETPAEGFALMVLGTLHVRCFLTSAHYHAIHSGDVHWCCPRRSGWQRLWV